MNRTERKFPFPGILVVLTSFLCITGIHAQNWQEVYLLNENNNWIWHTEIGHFPHHFIQQPDSSLGVATLYLGDNQNKVYLTFDPEDGVVGVAEIIIEYWPDVFPPHPTQASFRIFLVDSYIATVRDYATVEVNSNSNQIEPLTNDTVHGGGWLELQHLPVIRHGDAVINPDGQTVSFTPDTDFEGMAYISYVVCDSLGACEREEINIGVIPPGPHAATDTIYLSTDSRSPVTAFLPDSGFVVTQSPSHGSLDSLGMNAWEYKPNSSFSGVDEFVMTRDTTLERTVIVDVYYQPKPNAYANDDIIYTRKNESVSFDVIANDLKDYPLDSYTLPEFGTLTNDSLGHFTYEPLANYTGAVSFNYSTCFWPNCETAEVIIYVGDMIPENTITYELVTQQDVPLVVNYEIPLDGYDFTINAHPSSGTLQVHEGQDTVSVMCSDIAGYDLLVYEPDPAFTGVDAFEIYYCVDGGDCYLVKVDVSVQPDGSAIPCPCVDDCVWPGDVDQSGRVDMTDLLALGWHIGDVGTPRSYPNNTMWMGQHADDWDAMQAITEYDVKYADSDGDGVISHEDAQSILDHYLYRHTLVPEIYGLKADYPFQIIPLTTDLDSGDLAVLQIEIGNELNPVMDMHGVQFSLNLPPELVDSSSLNIDFIDDCWLGHDAPLIELQVQPWDGRIDAAMTRVTGTPATGTGAISIMTFIIEDDIAGFRPPGVALPLQIGVNGVSAINGSGREVVVEGEGTILYIGGDEKRQVQSLDEKFFIYPNPVTGDIVNLHLNGDRQIKSVEFFDMTARLMQSVGQVNDKHLALDVSTLQDGMYIARVVASDGVVSRKFEVLRSAGGL